MLADDLKATTAQVHEQLEKKMDIMSQLENMETYKNLLVRFYQYYVVMEEKLGQFSADLPLEERKKLHLLKADLSQLGFSENDLAKLSPASSVPHLDSLSMAVGSLYVLEGSTLGGQVISKHLRNKLGVRPETGGSFFWAYGEKTMEMWLRFKSFLNSYQGDQPKVLESARLTFLSLEKWLCA